MYWPLQLRCRIHHNPKYICSSRSGEYVSPCICFGIRARFVFKFLIMVSKWTEIDPICFVGPPAKNVLLHDSNGPFRLGIAILDPRSKVPYLWTCVYVGAESVLRPHASPNWRNVFNRVPTYELGQALSAFFFIFPRGVWSTHIHEKWLVMGGRCSKPQGAKWNCRIVEHRSLFPCRNPQSAILGLMFSFLSVFVCPVVCTRGILQYSVNIRLSFQFSFLNL